MEWFRLYHDLPNDRKLRKFTPQQKWAWVVLLCVASDSKERGLIIGEDEDDLADYCGFECTQDYQYFLDRLRQKEMISPVAGGIKISNWGNRQFSSDSSTERVRAHRNRKATEREQSCNVSCNVSSSVLLSDLDLNSGSDLKEEITTVEVKPINSCLAMEQGIRDRASRVDEPFQQAWDFYREGCKVSGASPGPKTRAKQAWNRRFPEGVPSPQFEEGLNAYWWVWNCEAANGRNPSKPPNFSTYINNPESYEQIAVDRQRVLKLAPQLASPKGFAQAKAKQNEDAMWASLKARGGAA